MMSRAALALALFGWLAVSESSYAPVDFDPSEISQESVLIQTKHSNVVKEGRLKARQEPSTDSASTEQLMQQVAELKEMVASVTGMLNTTAGCAGCCNCCGSSDPGPSGGGSSTGTSEDGLCAVFGDPHFTTFDGGHTIWLPTNQTSTTATLWLVKSQDIWIQGLSMTNMGDFMGFAVSGPFLGNHTLILYNATVTGGQAGNLIALFDGEEILAGESDVEFEEPFVLWAARRNEWSVSVHDSEILGIKPSVDWDVGPWPTRFQQAPVGGLYYFKLPNGVEVTATGVDYMTAVIRMAKQTKGQSGFCGDFDDEADNDYTDPTENYFGYENLKPAWNTPIGEDLDPVTGDDNLFGHILSMASMMQVSANAKHRVLGENPCTASTMKTGQKACAEIMDEANRAACVIDYCISGNAMAVDATATVGVMEARMSDGRVPMFLGHGPCRDLNGKAFQTIQTKDVRSQAACKKLLKSFTTFTSVLGAQLQTEGSCELLVNSEVPVETLANANELARTSLEGAAKVRMQQGKQLQEWAAVGDGDATYVAGVEKDLSWSCWRLD